MTRSRASAKKAGTSFETLIADCLNRHVDDRIERRTRNGARDRGDIGGVRIHGKRVVIEAKCPGRGQPLSLPAWTREAQIEAGHDDALVGVVCHKRHGTADPLEQWVTCTLADFIALLTGQPVSEGDTDA